MLIGNAVRDRASDIHIEPQEHELTVRYRVDGDMRKVMSPPKNSHQPIVTRIKILSNLNIAERRLPQDGRMVVKMSKREVDIRVSILPTVHGEKVVMRILDKDAFEKSVTNLGFNSHDVGIFKHADHQALRHDIGHRPHRIGKIDDAVFGDPGHKERHQEHYHRRRSGGIPDGRHQPGARQHENRVDIRQRAAFHFTSGPRRRAHR
jgi:hypothetical protein